METNFDHLQEYMHATRLGITPYTTVTDVGHLPAGFIDDGTIPRDIIDTMRLNRLQSKYLAANGSRFINFATQHLAPVPEDQSLDVL